MPPAPAPPPSHLITPPSFLRQRLNLEYSTLLHDPPPSIYLSPPPPPSPSSPSSPPWTGIFLPRAGPYCPSALRFTLAFPAAYPIAPPRVLFTTEVFHPLVVPLSAYRVIYSAPVHGTRAAETEDGEDGEGRKGGKQDLEPGEFDMRLGLRGWFESARKARKMRGEGGGSRQVSGESGVSGGTGTTDTEGSWASGYGYTGSGGHTYGVRDALDYVRVAFTEMEDTMRDMPLEGAANPSAWLAWRSWRRVELGIEDEEGLEREASVAHGGEGRPGSGANEERSSSARRPEQWDWTNVFLERVRRGCEGSLGDGALFGGGGEDMIRFLDVEGEDLERMKGEVARRGEVVLLNGADSRN